MRPSGWETEPMRILHTSDWHLGHTLHDLRRGYEHDRFLDWLLEQIGDHEVDALLIAGDIFDTANPSASAQRTWYRFLAEARRRYPELGVVVIGGNHDSADRLDAPGPLLADGFDVHVVGGLSRREDGSVDVDRLLVPLAERGGGPGALVAAVPFLRPADLRSQGGEGDPLIEGVRAIYREVLAAARDRLEPRQALVAMGHLYLASTELSEMSERRILGGNQHALPLDIFPDDLAYVALGHLHKAQKVGRDSVRYSGSPIPLSMAERTYRHQVCLVDLQDGRLAGVQSLPIPRAVDLLRIPAEGALPPDEVVQALRALPDRNSEADDELPFLEVQVLLAEPDPGLPTRVEEALEGKAARLVRLGRTRTGEGGTLADGEPLRMLDELLPAEVFASRYRHLYDDDPPEELCTAFDELLETVQERRGA